jgi:SHS2 domain-containing protein
MTPGMASASWSHFPHDADIGVVGMGPTKAEAFRQAGLALTAVITDPAGIRPVEAVEVTCRAPSDDLLLLEWLDALIYEMGVRGMVFGDYTVTIEGDELRAIALGEPVEQARHQPAVEIKGATFTALAVEKRPDGWRVQCVVDV